MLEVVEAVQGAQLAKWAVQVYALFYITVVYCNFYSTSLTTQAGSKKPMAIFYNVLFA